MIVTEYKIAHYRCPCCYKEVVANSPDCFLEGRFGKNLIAETTLLKYEDRIPHRKIQVALRRLHGLNICPATILDLTRRAADAVQSQYNEILERIRDAPILYVDETSEDSAITIISCYEILIGLNHRKAKREEQFIRRFFSGIEVLQFEMRAAEKASEIMGRLLIEGIPVNTLDVLIAGIAISNRREARGSRDRDFEKISQVSELSILIY